MDYLFQVYISPYFVENNFFIKIRKIGKWSAISVFKTPNETFVEKNCVC